MSANATAKRARLWIVLLAFSVLAGVIAMMLLVATKPAPPSTYTVTFPAGSTLRIDPDVFSAIPHRSVDQTVWLEFNVGDTLIVRNHDLFSHVLWAIRVRPGETVSYTFTQAGTFTGECTFDLEVFLEVRNSQRAV